MDDRPELMGEGAEIFGPAARPTELYREALAKWGSGLQLFILFEEIGELLAALSRLMRGTIAFSAGRMNVAQEIADVVIMLEQMAEWLHAWEEVKWFKELKLRRLMERLEEAGKNARP